jgi:hypothetical protein
MGERVKRDLVERARSININELSQDGVWKRPYVIIRLPMQNLVVLDRFRIEYRNEHWPRGRRSQVIRVTWTSCHFGGRRPWFTCACGQRAVRLFRTSMGTYGCRVCRGLAYQTQLQSPKRRIYRKAQTIRRLLGDDRGRPAIDPWPDRPYRMHRKTFRRHLAELRSLETQLRTGGIYRPKSRRQWDVYPS